MPTTLLTAPKDSHAIHANWQREAVESFHSRMDASTNDFPCIFGIEAVVRNALRYAFVGADGDPAESLAAALEEFTSIAESLGRRTSLVCFFETWAEAKTHDAYFDYFWNLLKRVSELDTSSWPDGVSRATNDSSFEFSFNGQAMFVVVNTDIHDRRRSRSFERVAVTFQPRFVFDDLREGTPRGDSAREIIRQRLAAYDDAPVTALLGSFGDPKNREWQQYYLDDGDASQMPGKCPVAHF
ncbi:YqcI/YcgG family protein [Leifsonia sp. Le1]|uniref:YqcI/YcgG family protein n=1 Tax=Leifsonia sp. Le1 TaxID=3404918 RepID=UPI003EBEA760